MKPDEIRSQSHGELAKRLEETRRELFNLRFRHATRQLVNTSELRRVKKDIARLLTIMREKELAER
ncbi:MAG: 50S ribosomal protein L29 [Dehalococcoidia bacterium]